MLTQDTLEPATAPVIAIDGPAASGKGTIAVRVAAALQFAYLDSGALYRLIALAAQREGIALDAPAALGALAARLPAVFEGTEILLAGEVVTDAIRAEAIGTGASRVAAYPEVRVALLARQRAFRRAPGLVAEGRDMGTVVFPAARLKVFLTASPAARAERRYKQLIEKGLSANMLDLLRDIGERDMRDSTRSSAPLKCAADALQLDTTSLTIEQAVEQVLAWWRIRE